MTDLREAKARAREAALRRRAEAHARGHPAPAARLATLLDGHRGRPLAGYVAMRAEIDPRPALEEAARHGPVGLPVMEGRGRPLRFRLWTPGAALAPGGFGTLVPEAGPWMEPEVLVVPLVAFDRQGGRLGYGGGFYDRTLAALRARTGARVLAIGFAWAAQQDSRLPLEPTDARLDLVATEAEVIPTAPLPHVPTPPS